MRYLNLLKTQLVAASREMSRAPVSPAAGAPSEERWQPDDISRQPSGARSRGTEESAHRRQRVLGLAAGVLFLAIVAVGAGVLSTSTDQSVAAEVDITLGGAPLQATSALGSVWVLTCQSGCAGRQSRGQIVRVDSHTGAITRRVDVVDTHAFAIGAGALWLAHFYESSVSRLDLQTGETTRTIALALPTPIAPGDRQFVPASISAVDDAVWVATARGWLAQIDPRTGRVAAMIRVPFDATGDVVAGAHVTWIAESVLGVGLVHTNPLRVQVKAIRTGRGRRVAVDQLAVGDGRVWLYGEVSAPAQNGVNLVLTDSARVITLDERTGRLLRQLRFPGGPFGVAFGDHALFAADFRSGHLYRIDARYRVRALPSVHGPGTLVAATSGAIWATTRTRVLRRIAVSSP